MINCSGCIGGTTLHAVIDQLLEQLPAHLSLNSPASSSQSHASQHLADPSDPWQCRAASVVSILSETIFGASSAWVHPWYDPATSQSPTSPSSNRKGSQENGSIAPETRPLNKVQSPGERVAEGPTPELDVGMMVMMLEELAQLPIRGLVTHNDSGAAVPAPALSQQV